MLTSVFRLMFATAALLIPLSAPTLAQTQCNPHNPLPVRVHGQLRLAAGGQPANRVIVRLEAFHGGIISEVVTDNTGKYEFGGLAPGFYVVTVHLAGFIDQRREVDLCGPSSAYELFQLVAERGNSETRANAYTNSIDANVPEPAQKEFEKAEAALAGDKKDRDQEAITHLEKAVRIYPKFLQAQLRLGTVYMDLQQWDNAEQALHRALEIDPEAVNALFALGEIYLRQKKDQDAEKVLLRGLQIEDHSFLGHLTLGRVYWDMALRIKDAEQAKPLFEKSYDQANRALELNPNLADAHLLKGNLLFRARRAKDALQEFDEYLRLDPKGQFADETRALANKIRKALAEQKL